MCQRSTPPTGREMNSPGPVSPESPLLFLIKTFLSLCTLFFFFPGGLGGEEGCFVTNLLLAGHTIKTYGLRFHRLGKENYLSSTLILGVLCTAAAGEYWITCLCSHLCALFTVTSMFSILCLYTRGWSTVMDSKPPWFSKIQVSPEIR